MAECMNVDVWSHGFLRANWAGVNGQFRTWCVYSVILYGVRVPILIIETRLLLDYQVSHTVAGG